MIVSTLLSLTAAASAVMAHIPVFARRQTGPSSQVVFTVDGTDPSAPFVTIVDGVVNGHLSANASAALSFDLARENPHCGATTGEVSICFEPTSKNLNVGFGCRGQSLSIDGPGFISLGKVSASNYDGNFAINVTLNCQGGVTEEQLIYLPTFTDSVPVLPPSNDTQTVFFGVDNMRQLFTKVNGVIGGNLDATRGANVTFDTARASPECEAVSVEIFVGFLPKVVDPSIAYASQAAEFPISSPSVINALSLPIYKTDGKFQFNVTFTCSNNLTETESMLVNTVTNYTAPPHVQKVIIDANGITVDDVLVGKLNASESANVEFDLASEKPGCNASSLRVNTTFVPLVKDPKVAYPQSGEFLSIDGLGLISFGNLSPSGANGYYKLNLNFTCTSDVIDVREFHIETVANTGSQELHLSVDKRGRLTRFVDGVKNGKLRTDVATNIVYDLRRATAICKSNNVTGIGFEYLFTPKSPDAPSYGQASSIVQFTGPNIEFGVRAAGLGNGTFTFSIDCGATARKDDKLVLPFN